MPKGAPYRNLKRKELLRTWRAGQDLATAFLGLLGYENKMFEEFWGSRRFRNTRTSRTCDSLSQAASARRVLVAVRPNLATSDVPLPRPPLHVKSGPKMTVETPAPTPWLGVLVSATCKRHLVEI